MDDVKPPVQQDGVTGPAPGALIVNLRPTDSAEASAAQHMERIQSIDVLRGFALLGILLMNIQSFAMVDIAYENPSAYGNLEGANYCVWFVSHVLADQKFMTIFSMLFGAGIVLMTSRQEKTRGRSAAVHYRRMGALALFGLLHAYLLWFGDILFTYAVCGLVAFLFRKLRPRTLLTLGFLAIAVPSLLMILAGVVGPSLVQSLPPDQQETIRSEILKNWRPSPAQITEEVALYQGSWLTIFRHRWVTSLIFETFVLVFLTFWRAGGLMLVGMALFKNGVFSAERSNTFYAVLVAVGACIGIPLIVLGVARNESSGWRFVDAQFLNAQFNYWASIIVSVGWVGLIMLWCRHRTNGLLLRALAAVGQMAFTNYMLHTLICTTIFYGYGFGLFGKVDRLGQLGIVLAIWTIQLVASPVWLGYFRFGPAEWIWRTMTYMRFQPLLRSHTARGIA